jgi:hypothetical protein
MDPDESLKRSHKQIMTTYDINEISIDDRVILFSEEQSHRKTFELLAIEINGNRNKMRK